MFLGIDLGTTGIRAVIVGEDGVVLADAATPLGVSTPAALWSEQRPDDWVQAAKQAIVALPSPHRRKILALAIAGQMHGATLLDESDQPLRPAILWNDGRSAAECEMLERREPRSRQITGNLAMPGFTAPKLLWVKRHEPQVFAKTRSVLLPKDYLRFALTGEKATDLSDASGTLWLDVGRRAWSPEMLAACDLAESMMPLAVEGTAPTGRLRASVAAELGLPVVPVYGGGGDNAASAVGMGVVRPGEAILSLGTSGVLFAVSDGFKPSPDAALHAFCHAVPGAWHQMSVMLSASSAVDWAARVAGFPDTATACASMSLEPSRSTPVSLPYLSGERTPHNDPYALGAFIGLRSATTSHDLVRSAMEGVAFGLAQGLDSLVSAGGRIDSITLVGGGSRLGGWLPILATALGRTLDVRKGGEKGAAVGAAALAGLGHAGLDPRSACPAPPIDHVVAPNDDLVEPLARRRAVFDAAYSQLKPLFRELS
jgi:xylulokinase